MKTCFLNSDRCCTNHCVAYDEGKTTCRILNMFERLVPATTRPVAPTDLVPAVRK
jgi:hypothetical protein